MGGVSKNRKTSARTVRRKKVCSGTQKRGCDKDKTVARDKYLQKTYGITLAEFGRLLEVYGGTCWICRRAPKPGKNLSVDHDHKVAKETKSVRQSIRGTLCFMCNRRLIGRRRREHAELFERAADYLKSSRAQHILGGTWPNFSQCS